MKVLLDANILLTFITGRIDRYSQDCCAIRAGAAYIITANVKDFYGHSKVKAISPDELLQIVEKQ